MFTPTLSVLEVVFTKTKNRGVVIIDDYGTRTCPGVFKTVNEFFFTSSRFGFFIRVKFDSKSKVYRENRQRLIVFVRI